VDDKNKQPSKSDIRKIEKILESADKKEPTIRRKPKQKTPEEKYKLGNAIATVLAEYTDCYILVGFDTSGNDMILVNSANNMEMRALSDLASDFLELQNRGISAQDFMDDNDD
jgi:short subunit fatty acids transporter